MENLDKEAKETNRWSISSHDFEKAIEYATEGARHGEDSILREACCLAAIVAYCRPFSSNERERHAKADSKLPPDFTPNDARHDQFMTMRNKALAHSEFAKNPTRLYPSGVFGSRRFCLILEMFNLQLTLDDVVDLSNKMLDQCHNQKANAARRAREGGDR